MATQAAQAFRPGDTRERDGWVYQRQQDGSWHPVRPAAGASAAPALVPLAPPDPTRAAAEARAQAAEGRAERAETRAAESHQREMTQGAQMAVEERKAAAFLRRAIGADTSYRGTGMGPRSLVGEYLHETHPDFLNQLPGAIGNSPQRQVADTNQDEFIAASLRQDSGAAIPPEELERQRRIYFPMPGDTLEAMVAKRAARRRAIEGLRDAAGRALTPELQNLLSQWQTSFDQEDEVLRRDLADRPEIAVGADSGEITGRRDPSLPPANEAPGFLSELGHAFGNVAAGVGEGLAAIPDAATNALGAVLGTATDIIPGVPEWVSENLRHPVTIGGAIDSVAPAPRSFPERAIRFTAGLTGGAASVPRAVEREVVRAAIGREMLPPPQPPAIPPPSRARIAEDARALDIPLLPADVGGPGTRVATAAIAQTPAGAAPVVNAAGRSVGAAGRALNRIASEAGAPQAAEETGRVATRGALAYRASSRTDATRLYDRAAELAEGVRVVPERALAALNRNIDELAENPAGDEALTFLTGLRDRLAAANGVTVAGLRGMRTQLRDRFFSAGLRGSDIERRVMQIVDEASEDVATSLTNAGRSEAAETYRAADAAWAARVAALDDVIMPIIGRRGEKSGEEVFRALQRASTTNGSRLERFIDALPAEDAGTVRASLINALGRASSGQQGAEGAAFTLDGFLTRWNDLGATTRNALFSTRQREAIEALARVAEASKSASAYANRSRTGGVVMTGLTGYSATAGIPTLMTVLATQYGAGRLLASPTVARALARIGGARSPRQAQAAIRELSESAARNPALANDIGALVGRLNDAFATSPATRAAAQQDEQVR